MSEAQKQPRFKWVGESLCLDFNNTVDWADLEPEAGELLPSYERLVAWGEEAGLLSQRDGHHLLARAKQQPAAARRALERAWGLRSTIHRIFFAISRGEPPEELERLNTLLAEVPAQVRPDTTGPTFVWGWPGGANDLGGMLWPVVWSAGQLLTSPDLARVKTCANDQCGWLFLDTSRKHNRKWCEMGICGNRAKARRFYQRRKRLATAKGARTGR